MDLYTIAIFMGIFTLVMLLLTFLIGVRVIKLSFKKHKFFAIITLALAFSHGILFVYMNFF